MQTPSSGQQETATRRTVPGRHHRASGRMKIG